jgi:hypothetical protein
MWRDYFAAAQILGIDRNPACKEQEWERVSVHIGSQVDTKFLDEVTAGHTIDVIIDDGSHKWAHQIESFVHLWPKLQPGGIYVIEDMHTSQARHAASYGQPPSENAALFFSRLGRLIAANGLGADETPDPVLESIRKSAVQVIFGPKYCIITKHG